MNKKHFDHEQSLKFEHSRLMALFTELDPNPVFRFDTEGKITMANKVGLEIFGSNFLYESKLSQIIPEMKESDLTSSISEGKKFNIDTKINDRYLQFTICGIPELKIGQIYGTDITKRKILEMELSDSEKRYRSLFENMLEGFAYCKILYDHDNPADFIYIDVNNAFEKLTGLKNVVGKKVSEVIPGIKESNPELFEIYGRVALTGKPERFEIYLESLGIWLSIAVYSPGKEYFVAVFDNITERKLAEEALHYRLAELETLFSISSALTEIETFENTLQIVLNKTVEAFNANACVLFSLNETTQKLECFASHGNLSTMYGMTLNIGEGVCGYVANSLAPYSFDDLAHDDKTTTDLKSKIQGDLGGICMPLIFEGRLLGTLMICKEKEKHFEPEEIQLLTTICNITANAIDSANKHSKIVSREQELIISEKKYRDLVENALVGVYTTNLEGEFLYANDALSKMLEYESADELINLDVKAMYKDIKDKERLIENISRTGLILNYEIELITKTRKIKNVIISAYLSGDLLTGMIMDITSRKRAEETLRKSEEKYRNLYEAIDQGTALCEVLTDKNGKPVDYMFLDINNKYTMLTGLTREMVIGKRALEINPQIEQYRIDILGDIAITGKSIYYEDYFPQSDKYYSVYAYCPIKNQFAVLISDITERKQTEEIIKESEEKYRMLFENEFDAIMILDIETSLFEDMNEASLNLFGYEKEEFLKLSLLDISVEPEKLKFIWEATKESVIQKGSLSVFKKKSGETFIGEISMGTFISKGKHKTFGVARDISERIQREKELKNTLENNKQLLKEITRQKKTLQKLSSSLTTVHELERKTISQELHDEIGQTLSAININLVSIEKEILPTISQRIKERFKETKELLETVLNQIQEISLKLRPLILDNLGLVPTLRWYISKYIERNNINVDFKVLEFNKRLNPEFELTIYRVVQEALTNVARHSQAKNVKIVMKMRNNCLEILIEDDGIGFNFNDVFDDLTTGRGIGIIHIQERIASLGGEVNFQTKPGLGTKIIIKLTL